MPPELPRDLRRDAAANREQILVAARALLAEEGLQVPIRAIARRAGVGPATLYRHFPTKQDLAVAAFGVEMARCRQIVTDGAADPDAWRGLCAIVTALCDVHVENRGFTAAFLSTYPHAVDLAAERQALLPQIARVAERAIAAGRLRADFSVDDFVLMLLAHRGVRASDPATTRAASRRFAQLMIQALSVPGTAAPSSPRNAPGARGGAAPG